MRVGKSGGQSGGFGSHITDSRRLKNPVYCSHRGAFKNGSLLDSAWTERQLGIIADEFDHREVSKPEVEFIIDKAEFLGMLDLCEDVYNLYYEKFAPKHLRKGPTMSLEEIARGFAELESKTTTEK